MPQSKNAKRNNAIKLYEKAIAEHEKLIAELKTSKEDTAETQIAEHQFKIKNLNKLIENTKEALKANYNG